MQRFQEFAGRVLMNADVKLGDLHSRRAEEIAKIESRSDIDRRHPSVAHPAGGLWWLLERLWGLPPGDGPSPVPSRGKENQWVC